MTILLVDVGNSRIKWAISNKSIVLSRGSQLLDDVDDLVDSLSDLPKPDRLVASNVAGTKGNSALEAMASNFGLVPEQIKSAKCAYGVTNCYDDPERLGTDRWAALIAAHSMQLGDCLVVSAGTAMTVDWLQADGTFAGGMIVPGRQLMNKVLSTGTAQVGYQSGTATGFSCNTADAVASGLACALSGAIKQARQKIIDTSGMEPRCLITGGDAAWLATMLDFPIDVVPDLVLRGLVLMANEKS